MAVTQGLTVLYSMLASDFGSKDVGAEGDLVPAIAIKVQTDYFGTGNDAYDIWVLPDGEPIFFRQAVIVGTDPGTIQEIGS